METGEGKGVVITLVLRVQHTEKTDALHNVNMHCKYNNNAYKYPENRLKQHIIQQISVIIMKIPNLVQSLSIKY